MTFRPDMGFIIRRQRTRVAGWLALAWLHVVATGIAGPAADGALTNWQKALAVFQQAGAQVGEDRLADAKGRLLSASKNLPSPYAQMSGEFAARLAAAASTTNADLRCKTLVRLCADLRAYKAALKLQKQGADIETLQDDAAYAWRLFEAGDLPAAQAEYKRRIAAETVDTFAEHYREQLRLVERHATHRTNAAHVLDLVKNHYLRGFEEQADPLGAARELFHVLPHAHRPEDSVAVMQSLIKCLASLGDEVGRDAWESRILSTFTNQPEVCASVLLERGMRAYSATNYSVALTLMRRICSDFPETPAYGDAQTTIGLILHDQGRYADAIAEYQKIFPSHVRDHDLDPNKSDDCKNYRHRAALRISECYAALGKFQEALYFAEQARDRYVYVSYCKTCLRNSQESLRKRLNELQAQLGGGSSVTNKN